MGTVPTRSRPSWKCGARMFFWPMGKRLPSARQVRGAWYGLFQSIRRNFLSDDSWLYLHSESEWPEVYDSYAASVAALGLEVNTSKVALHSKGSGGAEHAMQHGHIAYLVSGAAPYRTPQMATQEIRSLLDRDESDWNVTSFLFGSLRHHVSANGLSILYDHPRILQRFRRVI